MSHNDSKPNYSYSEDEDEEEEEETASGSEDAQISGSDSEQASDSDSEQQQTQKPQPNQTLIAPSKPIIKHHTPSKSPSKSSESEPEEVEESGSETDSDSPVKNSTFVDPNIKPISSIPMERERTNFDSGFVKKTGGSKTGSAPASKRPAVAPAGNEKDVKKVKGNATTTDDDSKKQLFQRLWSEDDEIVILKGMIDYKNESGENSIGDMGAFHEFIKKSLHVDVSRAQLVDKIRRLKKKYVNNASREKNGKDRSFSKSHEQKGYELSKLVWGGGIEGKKKQTQKNGNGNGNGASGSGGSNVASLVKSNGLVDNAVSTMEGEKNMDISRFVRYGGRDESPVLLEEIVKAGMELVEGSKKVELEERWKSLKKQELELYLKKMDFVKQQALVVLDAVNSSGN